eukprot:6676157-Karenia_brevis.AAC.1
MISNFRNGISGPIQKYLDGLQRIKEMQHPLIAPPFYLPLPTLKPTMKESRSSITTSMTM